MVIPILVVRPYILLACLCQNDNQKKGDSANRVTPKLETRGRNILAEVETRKKNKGYSKSKGT